MPQVASSSDRGVVVWNCKTADGNDVPPGLYFIAVTSHNNWQARSVLF